MDMSAFVQSWNQKHKELRRLLSGPEWHQEAISVFLEQHGVLHSAGLTAEDKEQSLGFSLEDELFTGLTDDQVRRIPNGEEHSVAWVIWHIARIEDITMTMLVAGSPQVIETGGWASKIGGEVYHSGNALDAAGVTRLSSAVNIEALRAYRLAVGRETRQIVSKLQPGDFSKKPNPDRLERIHSKGAVVEEARGIVDYWSKRTIAGLLLMPATRHNLVHLNEALRLKKRRD